MQRFPPVGFLSFLALDAPIFRLARREYEQADKTYEVVPVVEGQERAWDGDHLSNGGRPERGLQVGQPHGEKRPQDPSAIHREGGYQVEESDPDVPDEESVAEVERRQRDAPHVRALRETDQEPQDSGDCKIDGGPRDGDQEFLARAPGNPVELGHAADDGQEYAAHMDAEPHGGQGMAQLVEDHAGEEGAEGRRAPPEPGHPVRLPAVVAEIRQQRQEGDIQGYPDSPDAEQVD